LKTVCVGCVLDSVYIQTGKEFPPIHVGRQHECILIRHIMSKKVNDFPQTHTRKKKFPLNSVLSYVSLVVVLLITFKKLPSRIPRSRRRALTRQLVNKHKMFVFYFNLF